MIRKLVVALTAVCGCALPSVEHTDAEQVAYEALAQAWSKAYLPPTSSDCRLDLFQVTQADGPTTEETCGVLDYHKAYACSTLRNEGRPMHLKQVPYITISPIWHSEPAIIVHELVHQFAQCAGIGSDPAHQNPALWVAAGGEASVQSAAQATLRAQGWL